MGTVFFVIGITAVLFISMILLLAAKPKFAGKITGTFIVTVAVGGLLIYGYGFTLTMDSVPLAIVRALLAVCGMYVGKNDLSAISGAPLMQHSWMLVIFWILHLMALYATASAAITTVGAEALKKLRLWLASRGKLNLIYGLQANTLELGKELIGKNSPVIVVDDKPESVLAVAADKAGCVVRCDAEALEASGRFLKSIGVRPGREVTLYALNRDPEANLSYARACLAAFQAQNIRPQQLHLVILGQENETVRQLQVGQTSYGYGFVSVVQAADLAARLLVRSYPPCDTLEFDENGAATEDFETLIVGFGKMGQAVLKRILMNAVFEGSSFHATVFAPDCQTAGGYFVCQHEELLKNYDISFRPYDARSRQMFDHLRHRGKLMKYVAICTGSDKLNHEIAEDLTSYFMSLGIHIPVYTCSYQGVKAYGFDGVAGRLERLYRKELLSRDGLDRMAMVINQSYHAGTDKTAIENWMSCDYFSRQSCRASADFMGAVLRAAGKTREQALENWQLTAAQLENLSKSEHHRWCAFHYCMGITPMSREEFDARAAEYQRQLTQNGKATIRISKNLAGRTHACLTDWEGLAELSAREEKVTGKYVDYQQMDTQNILAVPELLKALEKGSVAE